MVRSTHFWAVGQAGRDSRERSWLKNYRFERGTVSSICLRILARQQEGNRISLPNLERPSSVSKQREENRTLVVHLSLVVLISRSTELVEAENLDFVTNV